MSQFKTGLDQICDVSQIAKRTPAKITIPEIIALGELEKKLPASDDVKTRLLLLIDPQNDFLEGEGTLPVPGSNADIERIINFIYENGHGISQIKCSKDTHKIRQIFHPKWWVDADGNYPKHYTEIVSTDVAKGIWRPLFYLNESIQYLEGLEAGGKKKLCIWPEHCLENTWGGSIEAQLINMIYFHSAVRVSEPQFINKGQNILTEMYGILKAEFDPKNAGFLSMTILKDFEDYDEIYIGGEAKSHCVKETIIQILDFYKSRPEITKKIYILEDCMSCVGIPGLQEETDAAFEGYKNQFQINIVQSTNIKF